MVLHEFRAGFKEHQHPQWAQHYIDCDAVIQGFADAGLSTRSIQKATVDNPISARRHDALPHPLSVRAFVLWGEDRRVCYLARRAAVGDEFYR